MVWRMLYFFISKKTVLSTITQKLSMNQRTFLTLGLLGYTLQSSYGVVISEFEPNPPGADPSTSTFELSGGTPSLSFDLWILSIENDGFAGTVDRASNVVGSYDQDGRAVVTTPDLENPSFTVVLTDDFTGSIGDDLDLENNGTLDLTNLGSILDAVGVSDNSADDASLYGASLGGTNILFNGTFEPVLVFRDEVSGDWFQSVPLDFGTTEERIGTFSALVGPELGPADFSLDPTVPSFGFANPSFIPEPSTALLGGLAMLTLLRRRR